MIFFVTQYYVILIFICSFVETKDCSLIYVLLYNAAKHMFTQRFTAFVI
jgi:hypothetical protein